jgi:hypothetical protein
MHAIGATLSRTGRGLILAAILGGLFLGALTPQPAQAQGEVRVVTGVVVDLIDGRATLSTNTGPATIQVNENTRYERQGTGTLSDIQPNQYVAVTGRPTGDGQVALLVRVFPVLQATVPARVNSPMDGPNTGNLMTNAIVESFANNRLTVRAAGESVSINTAPDTEVQRPEPASAADLIEGRRLVALGILGPDGVLQAALVNLLS